MTSGATRLRVPRGEARTRIIDAATDLFATRGYEATSVQDIVDAAHVTKGALYHWFGSKSELLNAIYRDLLAEQTAQLQTVVDGDAPVLDKLRRAALDLVEHTAGNAQPLTVWARSMHLLDSDQAQVARTERRRYHDLLRTLLEQGQDEGVVRPDLSASVMAHSFLSALNSMHTWYRPDGPLTVHSAGRQLAELFLTGVLPVPTTPERNHDADH